MNRLGRFPKYLNRATCLHSLRMCSALELQAAAPGREGGKFELRNEKQRDPNENMQSTGMKRSAARATSRRGATSARPCGTACHIEQGQGLNLDRATSWSHHGTYLFHGTKQTACGEYSHTPISIIYGDLPCLRLANVGSAQVRRQCKDERQGLTGANSYACLRPSRILAAAIGLASSCFNVCGALPGAIAQSSLDRHDT